MIFQFSTYDKINNIVEFIDKNSFGDVILIEKYENNRLIYKQTMDYWEKYSYTDECITKSNSDDEYTIIDNNHIKNCIDKQKKANKNLVIFRCYIEEFTNNYNINHLTENELLNDYELLITEDNIFSLEHIPFVRKKQILI